MDFSNPTLNLLILLASTAPSGSKSCMLIAYRVVFELWRGMCLEFKVGPACLPKSDGVIHLLTGGPEPHKRNEAYFELQPRGVTARNPDPLTWKCVGAQGAYAAITLLTLDQESSIAKRSLKTSAISVGLH